MILIGFLGKTARHMRVDILNCVIGLRLASHIGLMECQLLCHRCVHFAHSEMSVSISSLHTLLWPIPKCQFLYHRSTPFSGPFGNVSCYIISSMHTLLWPIPRTTLQLPGLSSGSSRVDRIAGPPFWLPMVVYYLSSKSHFTAFLYPHYIPSENYLQLPGLSRSTGGGAP